MHYSVLLVKSLLFVEADPTKLIDNLITERWKQEDVRPSARCDDYEFIRRLSLDLRGVISTSDEVRTRASAKISSTAGCAARPAPRTRRTSGRRS